MTENVDEIKSAKLSTLAQLVECLMKYEGLQSTKALSEKTGRSDSHIRKAKREISRSYLTAQIEPVTESRSQKAEVGQVEPSKKTGMLPALNTESPNGDTLSSAEVIARETIEEIPGLNGATSELVTKLAKWTANELGTLDLRTSRDLIAGNVEFHGSDKVRQGMLDLEALIASGERLRNVPKTFAVYVKNARLGGEQKQQPKENFVDRRRREAFELLEELGGLDEQAAH